MLAAINLGHNLAKEQQQEGEQHRHTDKLQPPRRTEVDGMVEEIGAEHDDGDVYQIVGNQDGGQRALRIFTQRLDADVALRLLLVQLAQVGRRQREESNLRSRGKTRYQQQQAGCNTCQYGAHRR